MEFANTHRNMSDRPELKLLPPTLGASATVVSWMLPLWIILIPIRAQVMGYGWYWLQSPIEQGGMVVAGAYLDLLYVIGLGTTFWILLRCASRTITRRIILTLFTAATIFSLVAALANASVVPMIGQPLTYPWLYYSGFLRSYDARMAMAAGLSWGIILGACCSVVVLVLGAVVLQRLARAHILSDRWRRGLRIAGLLALIVYVAGSIHTMRTFYYPTLQNPVVAMGSSMLFASNTRLFTATTSADTEDFRTVAERADKRPIVPTTSSVQAQGVQNIVVFVMESVAAQYLPAYGGQYAVTPELDSHRNHARLYRNIYAHAPSTNKSIVSLLCSMYPWPTYRFLTQEAPAADVVSISDVLSAQGYRTAFFSAADLRFGSAEGFLEHHRFDLLRDYRSIGDGKEAFASNEGNHLNGVEDTTVARALVDWIETRPNYPFFAVLWTNQTHYPYFPSKATPPVQTSGPGSEMLGRYLAALSDSDRAIGNLLRDLERLGIADSTLVVVVGDHGEAFGQHGRFGHGNTVKELATLGGNYGHGSDLYEENIHVPMIMINPRLFKGEEDSTVGGLVDIAPSVLDLLKLPLPGGWQGRSLMRPVERQRIYFTAPWRGALFGYREGDRKYLFDAIADTYRAFDLKRDPNEATNVAGDLSPEQRDRIYRQMAAWVQYQDRFVRSVMTPADTQKQATGRQDP